MVLHQFARGGLGDAALDETCDQSSFGIDSNNNISLPLLCFTCSDDLLLLLCPLCWDL